MDRNVLRSLTWYLTGHGPFNGHLSNIGRSTTDRCRFCGTEKETSEHLLFKCDSIAQRRLKFFKAHKIEKPNNKINMPDLLANIRDLNLNLDFV